MSTVLATEGLTKRFGGLVAVHSVSLEVGEQEIVGLIGPNGAGKTTFLNCVAGAERPSEGRVRLLGEDVTGRPPELNCRRGLGRTFQIPRPFPRMTAIENVMVAATYGRRGRHARKAAAAASAALDRVGFPRRPDVSAEKLTTMELKRLDLARALAAQPKILLLDELGAGLRPAEVDQLITLIRQLRGEGLTLVVVEHVMRLIAGVCDRLVVLHYGEKIADGPTAEVGRDPRVVEAYLGSETGIG